MEQKKITVFTPTFNRAYCLGNCYASLRRQTSEDFEWLIIDDGSTDDTRQLVSQWQKDECRFPIRYIYKENGGMHTAYNTAYENIHTELSVNLDSDDCFVDSAIEDILSFWKNNKRDDVGGIYALDQFQDGKVIGTCFPDDLKEFKGWGYKIIYYQAGGRKKKYVNHGDKKFIGVTKVINQYPPIPVIPGEKYFSLYYKQHLIERDYHILILNKPVCEVTYMSDGSSNNMFSQYIRNPEGFREERRFVMKHAPSAKIRLEAAIHYVAESFIAKDKHFINTASNKIMTVIALLPGLLLYYLIKRKTKG